MDENYMIIIPIILSGIIVGVIILANMPMFIGQILIAIVWGTYISVALLLYYSRPLQRRIDDDY